MSETATKKRDAIRLKARRLSASYPALLAEAERVAAIAATGLHGRRKSGTGETFWQYRPYNNTDAAHRIDWRRSAKSDALYVRDNEWEAANTIYFWQDRHSGMDWHSNAKLPLKSERAAIISMALANLLMQGGEHCGIIGLDQRSRTGRRGLERLFEDLILSNGVHSDFTSPIRAHSKVIIASDFLAPLDIWKVNLAQLAARPTHGILLHIIDPAEESFPYKGRLELKMPGLKSIKSMIVGRAETAQMSYQSRFERHITDIDLLAKGLGWHVIRHYTHDPASRPLTQLYGLLSGHPVEVS